MIYTDTDIRGRIKTMLLQIFIKHWTPRFKMLCYDPYSMYLFCVFALYRRFSAFSYKHQLFSLLWLAQPDSRLTLNHVDDNHLRDECVCFHIPPVPLCDGYLTLPDEDLCPIEPLALLYLPGAVSTMGRSFSDFSPPSARVFVRAWRHRQKSKLCQNQLMKLLEM